MTLSQWMKEHPRPAVEEAVFLIEQIARGIRALHRRETLHQGHQADNVMIDAQGRVKLLDFGSCRVAGIAEIATPLQRDLALGTASYSAPEYRVNRDPNYRSDLFSLAVISFEMLTGELPFGGKLENCRTQRDFLANPLHREFQLNPLVPHWIDAAIKKSLRYQAERRHADLDEFVYELRHPNPKYLEYRHRPLMEAGPPHRLEGDRRSSGPDPVGNPDPSPELTPPPPMGTRGNESRLELQLIRQPPILSVEPAGAGVCSDQTSTSRPSGISTPQARRSPHCPRSWTSAMCCFTSTGTWY